MKATLDAVDDEPIVAAPNGTTGQVNGHVIFVVAVSLFLALTGIIKLFSILLEIPILRTRDPIISILTMRQMLFLAAVIELAVAWNAWIRKTAQASVHWILWVTALFTAYRFGLHTVHYTGPCHCLGMVPDWLPGADNLVDRLLLGALALMWIGGLYFSCRHHGYRVALGLFRKRASGFPGLAAHRRPLRQANHWQG